MIHNIYKIFILLTVTILSKTFSGEYIQFNTNNYNNNGLFPTAQIITKY